MNSLFVDDAAFEKHLASRQTAFDYNCSKFLVQEIDLLQQIEQAKQLLESLNKYRVVKDPACSH